MKKALFFSLVLFLSGCLRHSENEELPARYVNPFIGTQGPGNVIPGALRPHGLVKLSPDNVGSPLSGYEYDIPFMSGFSHLHLEGTGSRA